MKSQDENENNLSAHPAVLIHGDVAKERLTVRLLNRFASRLFDSIDIAPLVFFRVAFGGLMLWEVWRYFHFDRIARYYVEPTFFFHYLGFHWVRPLPGDGMFWLFHGLGLLSIAILLGAFYRLSITLFWLGFSYVFLLDQAQYLNHFYLVSLFSFLMMFIPMNRALSVDVLLRPSLRSQTAPAWALWLLRGQMAMVYCFGGLAKINPDWLAGEPLRLWLSESTDFPLIGHWFTEEWMVYLFSFGGLLLDLLVVPLLLWPKTRIPALALAVAFHLINARLFNIGIFPWFAIAATLIFLPPAWFRPRWLRPALITGPALVTASQKRWVLVGMAAYFAIQIALPLRHWLYPGDPSWSEEGHTLAWHMRLRVKSGTIAFYASTPATGLTWRLPAETYLSHRQFDQMKDNPQMILRFAHHLAQTLENAGHTGVQIRAWSMMSLNRRAPQLLIDPTADLAREADDLLASDWILPLMQRPFPAEPRPALLISRRYPGVLLLVNVTQQPYPLAELRLSSAEHHLDGTAFGVQVLMPAECLLAHTENANLQMVFAPCNETGDRLVIHPQFTQGLVEFSTRSFSATCAGPQCVVTDGETP